MHVAHLEVRKLVVSAMAGAVISEILVWLSVGPGESLSRTVILGHFAAIVIGAFAGLSYEIFRALLEVTNDSLKQVSVMHTSVRQLSEQIKYQDSALKMLLSLPRHNEALSALITQSMSDNFRNIPYVTMANYMTILEIAIRHADTFEAVQRHPLRWYEDSRATGYLHALRDERMKYKTRLFVLDDMGQREMEVDVADPDALSTYWRNTGDVDSLWVSEANFRRNFPQTAIPEDFALFDEQLYIAYNEEQQILSFDVLAEDSIMSRIFRDVRHLVASHADGAFRRVPVAANVIALESVREQ